MTYPDGVFQVKFNQSLLHGLIKSLYLIFYRFLTYNPAKRITADDALRHPYFQESPLPIEESMFPTWPAKSEMTRTTKAIKSPKPPEGGLQYANLVS